MLRRGREVKENEEDTARSIDDSGEDSKRRMRARFQRKVVKVTKMVDAGDSSMGS